MDAQARVVGLLGVGIVRVTDGGPLQRGYVTHERHLGVHERGLGELCIAVLPAGDQALRR
jgi:hypothetical protein